MFFSFLPTFFFLAKKKVWWPWRESNPRQTRFRKPPLYPTELQSHLLFNYITKTAPLEKPACICLRKRNSVFLDSTSVAVATSACPLSSPDRHWATEPFIIQLYHQDGSARKTCLHLPAQTQLRFSRLHLGCCRNLGLPIVLAGQALSYRAIHH